MRIHFISLHIEQSSRSLPLGAAMVASSVQEHFADTLQISLVDCFLTDPTSVNRAKILDGDPDCLGFSVYLWNTQESITLIRSIKESHPDCCIVVGGPQPTGLPEYFSSIPEIDYIITGEAEASAILLFQSLLDDSLPRCERIIPGRLPILRDLPSPYLSGLIDLKKYTGALWELSRGCPYRCAFCFESRGTSVIRRFPPERIQQELELFQRSGIREILVLDPTFNFNKKIAKRNLRMILETAPEIHFTFEIRAEHIDEEMAYLFSQLNCSLQIGLQSIHQPVLEKINRTFHSQEFFDHVLLLHHEQIPYGFDLIYGLPEDTLEGFLESLDFTFSMIPNHIDIFPLSVLPGTEIYDRAESYQLSYDKDTDYTVTHTPTFSRDNMAQAARIADSVDRFYNQGKAVSWFDILLTFLDLGPSDFFTLVCDLIPQPAITDILEYQLTVVAAVLQHLKISGPWLTIKETIRYFWLSNNVLSSAQNEGPFFGIYTLNPQLQLGTFEINPLEIVSLMENGIQDFDELTRQVSPCRVYLAVYEADAQIQHYECTLVEYELLEAAGSRNGKVIAELMNRADSVQLLTQLEAWGLVSSR